MLGFVAKHHIFCLFPAADEGELTSCSSALVNNRGLAVTARQLGLHAFLLHGPKSQASGGRARSASECAATCLSPMPQTGGYPFCTQSRACVRVSGRCPPPSTGADAFLVRRTAQRGLPWADDPHEYDKLLADTFEAFLGALYLDRGLGACRAPAC